MTKRKVGPKNKPGPKMIDITGQRFGRLVAIERVGNKGAGCIWLCQCDCGEKKAVNGAAMRRGNTKSCGCLFRETRKPCAERIAQLSAARRIDLTGLIVGMMTVIGFSHNRDIGPRSSGGMMRTGMWLCRCECGNEKAVSGDGLRRGVTRHCGCIKKVPPGTLPIGEAARRRAYREYMRNAERRGNIYFNLTIEEFDQIATQSCYYCGVEASPIRYRTVVVNGEYAYNGLDRVDNSGGYTTDNVVSCCARCNIAKGTAHKDDFLLHVLKIYKHTLQEIEELQNV